MWNRIYIYQNTWITGKKKKQKEEQAKRVGKIVQRVRHWPCTHLNWVQSLVPPIVASLPRVTTKYRADMDPKLKIKKDVI